MSFWKEAGLTYNRYAAVAARATRRALKEDKRIIAERRETLEIRAAKWADGKQLESKDEKA
ncbi:mitochondrial ATP synthase epsilon chain-domain-containing protein [Lipomyces oligophaga]|uniref:mitochondrial ATP synthase epsilon chain-domain-containing protein n=1 Tax=Lipomyces oligophaga TaxID=45792 RepID=UPI0034D0036A